MTANRAGKPAMQDPRITTQELKVVAKGHGVTTKCLSVAVKEPHAGGWHTVRGSGSGTRGIELLLAALPPTDRLPHAVSLRNRVVITAILKLPARLLAAAWCMQLPDVGNPPNNPCFWSCSAAVLESHVLVACCHRRPLLPRILKPVA